jgi:hypothetical protein
MTKPMGKYLYSDKTLTKANVYLKQLQSGEKTPGMHLGACLKRDGRDIQSIEGRDLITMLMNTRQAQIFAESDVSIDGSDWNIEECSILGDVSFNTTNTVAFNNGAHVNPTNHVAPLPVNFLFVASALMRNGRNNPTPDMKELLNHDNSLNEEAYFELYERRLLPGLILQNSAAKKDNVKLVINIPGLGLGNFAGAHREALSAALPRVLKRLFTKHAALLDQIHTVNYDPYEQPSNDEFSSIVPNGPILQQRPFKGLPKGALGTVASQLEFPKDGTNYQQGFRLLKIVAWDHFSFPGNDIWGNRRATDDGVSFASSDVLKAMFEMGQLQGKLPTENFIYNPASGILKLEDIRHEDLAKRCPSHVTSKMIEVVSLERIINLFKHRKENVHWFLIKLDELDAYAEKLLSAKKSTELARTKSRCLQDMIRQMRITISELTATNDVTQKKWDTLNTKMQQLVNETNKNALGAHRAPLQRWLKEFVALFATFFVGSLGITFYNYYNAPKGSFSFNDVGFFKETTSLKKVNDLKKTCAELADYGNSLERAFADAPQTDHTSSTAF